MADIAVTAANVARVSGSAGLVIEQKFAGSGVTITAGQSVALQADGTLGLFDANSGTAALRSVYGLSLNGGGPGQPIAVQRGGTIAIGGTAAAGTVYVGSATAGGICPAADLSTGHYTNIIGIGLGNSQIKLGLLDGGVAVA